MEAWTLWANLATLFATVLAIAGLWLAWQTAREQRHNRDFPSDKAYADEFDRRAARLTDEARRGYERKSIAAALNAAVASYGPAHRTDRRDEVRTMMGRHTQRAERILLADPRTRLTFDDAAQVQRYVDHARRIAEDWAYPERRREMMTSEYRVQYQDDAEAGSVNDYPEEIQVRHWLLTGLPSDISAVRIARAARSWIDHRLYDIAQRRVTDRIRMWRHSRRVESADRAALRRQPSASQALTGSRDDASILRAMPNALSLLSSHLDEIAEVSTFVGFREGRSLTVRLFDRGTGDNRYSVEVFPTGTNEADRVAGTAPYYYSNPGANLADVIGDIRWAQATPTD